MLEVTMAEILDMLQIVNQAAKGQMIIRKIYRYMKRAEETGEMPLKGCFSCEDRRILRQILGSPNGYKWINEQEFWLGECADEVLSHFYDECFYRDVAGASLAAEAAFELKADLTAEEAAKAILRVRERDPALASKICESIVHSGTDKSRHFDLYSLSLRAAEAIVKPDRPYFMPDSPIWNGTIADALVKLIVWEKSEYSSKYFYTIHASSAYVNATGVPPVDWRDIKGSIAQLDATIASLQALRDNLQNIYEKATE